MISGNNDLPRRVWVGQVPFLLGPMGPGEDAVKGKDLIVLTNVVPDPSQNGMAFQVSRRLDKFYLLSLNLNLPMKSYVPAVEVVVRYNQGEPQNTWLIPPLNFDTCYQDFGINTRALTLPIAPEQLVDRDILGQWEVAPVGYDLGDLQYALLLRLTFCVCNTNSCRLLARLQIIGCSDSRLACVKDYLDEENVSKIFPVLADYSEWTK